MGTYKPDIFSRLLGYSGKSRFAKAIGKKGRGVLYRGALSHGNVMVHTTHWGGGMKKAKTIRGSAHFKSYGF